MKIVHFTHNVIDGAGKAAYRLHKALQREEGLESLMLVCRKGHGDDSVIQVCNTLFTDRPGLAGLGEDVFRKFFRAIPYICRQVYWKMKRRKWKPLTLFNFNIPYISMRRIKKYLCGVDIICLHSVQSFLSPGLIRDIHRFCRAPVVWTLMDVEPLTGGCHFSGECRGFAGSCGNCPQLAVRGENDISRRIWKEKREYFRDVPLTFVAASSWVREHIADSSLFGSRRIEKIFLGADRSIFERVHKKAAREILGLPEESRIILFGCFDLDDRRKGADHLERSLSVLPRKILPGHRELFDQVVLVTFGRTDGRTFSGIPFKWIHLGELRDDRLIALSYQAADVLACPSIDDFGPMIVNEAFMCDLPVVAFDRGVAPDLVKTAGSGYIARRYDTDDFSSGILKCLSEEENGAATDEILRLKEMCRTDFQARQYARLFEKLLSEKSDKKGVL